MAERHIDQWGGFLVPGNETLIGVLVRQDGRAYTRFFASEDEADAALGPAAVDEALQLAGSWSDLPWREMADTLHHMRHDTPPSAPLEG